MVQDICLGVASTGSNIMPESAQASRLSELTRRPFPAMRLLHMLKWT